MRESSGPTPGSADHDHVADGGGSDEQACDDGERQLADRTAEGQPRKVPDDYTYDQNNQSPLALKKTAE